VGTADQLYQPFARRLGSACRLGANLWTGKQSEVTQMKVKALIAVAVAAVAAVPVAGAGAASSGSPRGDDHDFEGTVVSKNREARTFRLRDSERGTVRIKVTRKTRFERINGFAGLKVGARNIEVDVGRRSNGAWLAREVERSGGGGEHGGRDDRRGGDDDGPGEDRHGGDDRDDDNSGPGS
jgi:hypothetical protein